MRNARVHLIAMLLVAGSLTLGGAAPKAACATRSFAQTGATSSPLPCYSDLSVLYGAEQLETGRFPYLDPCVPSDHPCDEYPVGTMLAMWGAAQTGGALAGFPGFFWANALLMMACAAVCVWVLERLKARTVLFAAAPSLALYATLNWDLVAVAAATIATWFVLRRKTIGTGIWLGVGAAAKLYPSLLVIPFSFQRSHDDERHEGVRLAGLVTGVFLGINVWFITAAPSAWSEVFRFNSDRGADFESMWTVLCQLHVCVSTPMLDLLIPIIAVAALGFVWRRVMRLHPGTPPWMMGFPLLVIVVVSSKFWSPQYALWLLPWFALSRIPARVWLAYQAAEVSEYFARSSFMSGPTPGISLALLSLFVAFRAAMLVRCLMTWMRDPFPVPVAHDTHLFSVGGARKEDGI